MALKIKSGEGSRWSKDDGIINVESLARERRVRKPHGVHPRAQPALLVQNHLRSRLLPRRIKYPRRTVVELNREWAVGWPDYAIELHIRPYFKL